LSTDTAKRRRRAPNKTYSMSVQELQALDVTVDIRTAGRAFGLAPSTSQAKAASGDFPVKVLRYAREYRVLRADLLRALGMTDDAANSEYDQPIAQVG
jgi:hypothetical protein